MRFKDGSSDKLRGGYYTAPPVAEWLCRWAIRSPKDAVLEPSCGDGVFLRAAAQRLAAIGASRRSIAGQVTGIEVVAAESAKAEATLSDLLRYPVCVQTKDFFEWLMARDPKSFDCVVGNPPFIRYQSFPQPARTLAMALMERLGMRPNRLTNIWVPFVVGAASCLAPGGRLAMVLPAELLQVSYAGQLRQYLADSFRNVTVFACNEMFFENAEQEVVLLAADGKLAHADKGNRCDIALVEADNLAQLLRSEPKTNRDKGEAKFVKHDTEKWLKYFLDAREIEFMRSLRENPTVTTLGEHAAVDVGIVTGKNEFFVLSRAEVERYHLHRFVISLVARSAHLSGAVLSRSEHGKLGDSGKRVYLLHLAVHGEEDFTPGLRTLILEGERNGYHRGYKCSIRNPWYHVPAVWQPDCFCFRQIYDFPRVVLNKAGATSTDTIHRMRCRRAAARVAENLYTHLTAASAEIEGRSYGGGVLELEPTEAERLLVPRCLNGALAIEEVDRLVREGRLAEVLEYNDRCVLQLELGLSRRDCTILKNVWSKMRDRRRARHRR